MQPSLHRYTLRAAILLALLLLPSRGQARGGGGCLETGTPILTPSGSVPIEELRPGDIVLGIVSGRVRQAAVSASTQVRSADIIEITAGGRVLRATPEHPVGTGAGIFRKASVLRSGDPVLVASGGTASTSSVTSVRRIRSGADAFNLLVAPGGTYVAGGMVVHNKGCFLPETRIRLEDGSEHPISRIRPGDRLLAFADDGTVVPASVRSISARDVAEYRIVRTERMVLQVTAEHPFYAGNGTFRTLEVLRPGDGIYAYDGTGWSKQRILSLETVSAPTRVYNLQTDAPHTFFANGIAVHNKGGGGGCFPAGTTVRTPSGTVPIEMLAAGDAVIAVDAHGRETSARIGQIHATTSALLRIGTRHGHLVTTEEHPLLLASGEFIEAGGLVTADRVMLRHKGFLKRSPVFAVSDLEGEEVVYNLTVDGPHTFIANGFVVHNKGGGGGGGGSRGGGRSYSSGRSRPLSPEEGRIAVLVVVGAVAVLMIAAVRISRSENLDQRYSRSDIEKKTARTLTLVRFIAKQDPSFSEDALSDVARSTFLRLQTCWQEREYGPMQPLMMADLFRDHLRQIEGMRRNHEINRIDGLRIDAVDLVNVRYPLNREEREFTALITATAQDYYLDDRSQKRLRGDDAPAQFQEFWTFQFQGGAWLLREIEQAAESDILKDDNFFEQFTDKAVDQVYGEAAGTVGPAGPWAEGATLAKEGRIERMLNYLVRTDKLWARNSMLQTARSTFIGLTGAWETGTLAADVTDRLFPELARHLADAIGQNVKAGITIEFRNLAVRKVELVLVKNFADNRNDEFVVRVRAHAQKAMKRDGMTIRQDDDVSAFEEYLTFGRLDSSWKLKEIIAPEAGKDLIALENIDEGSSPQMIAWYYQHKRSV